MHFGTLVLHPGKGEDATEIHDEVAHMMARYDENLEVAEYADPDFDWAEQLASAKKWLSDRGNDDPHTPKPGASDLEIVQWYEGYGTYKQREDGTYERWITRNPDGQWDYWRIGGRWSGHLVLKPVEQRSGRLIVTPENHWDGPNDYKGNQVDSAVIADIDFEAMRNDGLEEMVTRFEFYRALCSQHGEPQWNPGEGGNVDQVRAAYQEHPVTKAYQARYQDGPFNTVLPSRYGGFDDTEHYRYYLRLRAVPLITLVTAEGWFHRSGWGRQVEDIPYLEQVNKIIEASEPFDRLTVLDYHS